jgi:hypothetical protein
LGYFCAGKLFLFELFTYFSDGQIVHCVFPQASNSIMLVFVCCMIDMYIKE